MQHVGVYTGNFFYYDSELSCSLSSFLLASHPLLFTVIAIDRGPDDNFNVSQWVVFELVSYRVIKTKATYYEWLCIKHA